MNDDSVLSTSSKAVDNAREYYGKVLASNDDLKTTACCSTATVPGRHRDILAAIDDEILSRFYGCGSPLPPALEGTTILDLGCGTGRDVYLASALAGAGGCVIGVDATEEQLEVAQRHRVSQAERFGLPAPNTAFHHGLIEDLGANGIEDGSVDVVISNCVINLSGHKDRVFREIFRVLKPGGELYFADVFADRRLPQELAEDPVLHGECLGGAMYREDFRRLLAELGCRDLRIVSSSPLDVTDPEAASRVGGIRFTSETIRAFKLEGLEDRFEDYGQTAVYLGGLDDCPDAFELDGEQRFERGRAVPVCGNTALMLSKTRYAPWFEVRGDFSRHYGLQSACCAGKPEPKAVAAKRSCC